MSTVQPSQVTQSSLAHFARRKDRIDHPGRPRIGRAIALSLAARGVEAGLVSRTEDELAQTVFEVEAIDGEAAAFARDLTDLDLAQTLVGDVEVQLGPLDILINNAGTVDPVGPTELLHCPDIERPCA